MSSRTKGERSYCLLASGMESWAARGATRSVEQTLGHSLLVFENLYESLCKPSIIPSCESSDQKL